MAADALQRTKLLRRLVRCAAALVMVAMPLAAHAQIGSARYSSIVVDASSGEVLEAANADALRHPASLTKMMTLYMAFEALRDHDLVCVHVEAPDEASHEGRADAKVKALEEIDRHIVGPLLAALPEYGDWRILVSPDHRTPLRTRAHAHGAVPFAMAGTGIAPAGQPSYDEAVAAGSAVAFERGHELMRRFLG